MTEVCELLKTIIILLWEKVVLSLIHSLIDIRHNQRSKNEWWLLISVFKWKYARCKNSKWATDRPSNMIILIHVCSVICWYCSGSNFYQCDGCVPYILQLPYLSNGWQQQAHGHTALVKCSASPWIKFQSHFGVVFS
jgi:hypothetical protein